MLKSLCLILAALASWASFSLASAANLVTLAGPSIVRFGKCDFAPTLRFRATGGLTPKLVTTEHIGAATADTPEPTWSPTWDQPVLQDAANGIYTTVGHFPVCPDVGTYAVDLKLSDGQPNGAKESLSVTIQRLGEPTLYLPPTVTTTISHWPFLASASDRHISIPLKEDSGLGTIQGLTVTVEPLHAASGDQPPGVLGASVTPLNLSPGADGKVDLTMSSLPSPGVYTANVRLHYRNSGDPKATVLTVKIASPVTLLMIILLLGVVGGYFVNVVLVDRQNLDAAKTQGFQAVDALRTSAMNERDLSFRRKILDCAADLETKVNNGKAPDDIKADVQAARDSAAQIAATEASELATLTSDLTKMRATLQPSAGLDSQISLLLRPVIEHLDPIEDHLTAGDLTGATAKLKSMEGTYLADLQALLQPWLLDVKRALDALGQWNSATVEPEKTRSEIVGLIQAAFPATDPAAIVGASDQIARNLRSFAVFVAPAAIAQVFRNAANQAVGTDPELASTLANQGMQLEPNSTVGDPIAVLRALASARSNMEAAILVAGGNADAIRLALQTGNFAGAISALQQGAGTRPPEAVAAPGPAVAAPEPVERDQTALPPPAQRTPVGMLQATMPAPVSRTPPSPPTTRSVVAGETRAIRIVLAGVTALLTVSIGYGVFHAAWLGTYSDSMNAFLWGFFGQFSLDRLRTTAQPLLARPLS